MMKCSDEECKASVGASRKRWMMRMRAEKKWQQE